MEIRKAKTSDIENLFEFNARIYPNKKIDSRKLINFWISKSRQATSDIVLFCDDNGKIVGQVINSSTAYYFQNEKIDTVWGFDLIIEKKYRKDTWGIDLILKNIEAHPRLMATGSGPLAKSINLKLGMIDLGDIRKYVGIINPFWIFNSFWKGKISFNKFPSEITMKNKSFVLIDKSQIPTLNFPFNNNLLEIVRDKEFMQWRFFNSFHDYAVYKDKDSNNYFILRTTIIKHITVMLLVDYRCNSQTSEQFETILLAAKRITSKLHLPILITGSTLKTFDAVLEQHHFRSFGRPRPVLGFIKCKDRKEDIDNRNFVFVTLADSDGETNWI